jgi:hypothetical protein
MKHKDPTMSFIGERAEFYKQDGYIICTNWANYRRQAHAMGFKIPHNLHQNA